MMLGRFWASLTIASVAALFLAMAVYHPSSAASADPATISVKDFMFAPTSLTVMAGSTVTWANLDAEPHTVVSETGLFRSGALDTNDTFSFRFDKPGAYHFVCSIHPQMVGTIVVQ